MKQKCPKSWVAIGFYVLGSLLIVSGLLVLPSVWSDPTIEVEVGGTVFSGAAVKLLLSGIFYGALIALFGGFVQIVADIRWLLAANSESDSDA